MGGNDGNQCGLICCGSGVLKVIDLLLERLPKREPELNVMCNDRAVCDTALPT